LVGNQNIPRLVPSHSNLTTTSFFGLITSFQDFKGCTSHLIKANLNLFLWLDGLASLPPSSLSFSFCNEKP